MTHATTRRPTVAFDVLGTLFGLDRLRGALAELGAPSPALELWFAQSLRDFFALSYAGGYAPIREVLESALPRTLRVFGIEAGESEASNVVARITELDPSPGSREGCTALAETGATLVALSNGSVEITTELLQRAGMLSLFRAVRSCDEVSASKPDPRVYALAREHAGEEAPWLVAAHAWDLTGASRAGFRTAWVSAVEGEWLSAYPPPTLVARDVDEACQAILAES